MTSEASLRICSELIGRSVGPIIRVEVEAEGTLPAVDVDPNQLEMALLDLAVNARDAMVSGGVFTIGLSLQKIGDDNQLRLRPGRYVVLSVKDTGEGMDAETLAKAVEPFFSTKGVGKGTGLGLSMVFGLAEQSGGVLRLQSACRAEQPPRSGCQLPRKPRCPRAACRTSSLRLRAERGSFLSMTIFWSRAAPLLCWKTSDTRSSKRILRARLCSFSKQDWIRTF